MKTEESAINHEAVKEHKFAMSAGNTETDDLLKRIKPFVETIRISSVKYTHFTEENKTERDYLLEVIKFHKEQIRIILGL